MSSLQSESVQVVNYSKTITFSGQTTQVIHEISSGSGWWALGLMLTSYNGVSSIVVPFFSDTTIYVRTYGNASNAVVSVRLSYKNYGGWPE